MVFCILSGFWACALPFCFFCFFFKNTVLEVHINIPIYTACFSRFLVR